MGMFGKDKESAAMTEQIVEGISGTIAEAISKSLAPVFGRLSDEIRSTLDASTERNAQINEQALEKLTQSFMASLEAKTSASYAKLNEQITALSETQSKYIEEQKKISEQQKQLSAELNACMDKLIQVAGAENKASAATVEVLTKVEKISESFASNEASATNVQERMSETVKEISELAAGLTQTVNADRQAAALARSEQSKIYTEALEKQTVLLEKHSSNWAAKYAESDSRLSRDVEYMTKTVESAVGFIKNTTDEFLSRLVQVSEHFSQAIAESTEQAHNALTASTEQANQALASSTNQAHKALSETAALTAKTIEQSTEKAGSSIASAAQDANKTITENAELTRKSLAESACLANKSIADNAEATNKSLAETQQNAGASIREIASAAGSSLNESTAACINELKNSFSGMAEQLNSTAAALLKQADAQTKATQDKLNEGTAGAQAQLAETAAAMKRYSDALQVAAGTLNQSFDSFKSGMTGTVTDIFAEIDKNLGSAAAEFAKTVEEINDASARIPKALKQVL